MVSDPFKITVGTTVTQAVAYNKNRTALGIANLSDTAVLYFGHTQELTTAQGFPILSKTITFFNKGLGDNPWLQYFLISDTANTDVRIMEFWGDGV